MGGPPGNLFWATRISTSIHAWTFACDLSEVDWDCVLSEYGRSESCSFDTSESTSESGRQCWNGGDNHHLMIVVQLCRNIFIITSYSQRIQNLCLNYPSSLGHSNNAILTLQHPDLVLCHAAHNYLRQGVHNTFPAKLALGRGFVQWKRKPCTSCSVFPWTRENMMGDVHRKGSAITLMCTRWEELSIHLLAY